MIFAASELSSLPQSLSTRPRPSLLSDGRLSHPVRKALLGSGALQVVPCVPDQERQQIYHFLLQTGSLLSQPGAQGAEGGENKGVAITTGIHLTKTIKEKEDGVRDDPQSPGGGSEVLGGGA